jgi:hypothetical protein
VLGTCKLCEVANVALQKSHYAPAALYPKNITLEQLNEHGVTKAVVEITDYLLCSDCEQRFSRLGESEVLGHIAGKIADKPNPLVLKLTPLTVLEEDDTLKSYCGTDASLNMDRFAYFALSMIWRGTHSWPKPGGGHTRLLQLGLYKEPIRAFLAKDGMPFPSEVAVIVIVCTDKTSREAWLLPAQTDDIWFHDVRFLALGVMFRITLGKSMPDELMRNSCHLAGKRIHLGDGSKHTKQAMKFLEALH